MRKGLIIVESPAKARTIQKMVKAQYEVKASMGHIRDLPKSKLGVDIENNFSPTYIIIRGKASIIKDLKTSAQKYKEILLAPDPDREGEAIAWHLAYILGDKKISRIELHEITPQALKQALLNPHEINLDRVLAQQARRILDRLVGYKLSPLLWEKIRRGLSAGRVQSVAVYLICQREKEIQAFKQEEYWTINANLTLENINAPFQAALIKKEEEKIKINNQEEAEKITQELENLEFKIKEINLKEQKNNPPPPFITSTLQQGASLRLGFKVAKTMFISQQLYEGLEIGGKDSFGLITYMRTDSMRVSQEAKNEGRKYIKEKFGENFIGPERKFKARLGAQEAHEAIRPTQIYYTPQELKEYLNNDQYRLYKLIWERFIASLMSPSISEIKNIDIKAGNYLLRAQGLKVKFPGYTILYDKNSEENNKLPENIFPNLEINQILKLISLEPKQNFTQPPPRYTEASLIKALEEKGIGRPSTYAPTVGTIQKREYVILEDKRFHPTKLGFLVNELLIKNFSEVINIDFTASLEEKLDQIEEGKINWIEVLREFYQTFSGTLEKAKNEIEKIKLEPEVSSENCSLCGKPMLIKRGKFGKFLACSGYPECKNTKPFYKEIGLSCPQSNCQGKIIERQGKKGKFYGCSLYPQCNFISRFRPIDKRCESCGKIMALRMSKNKNFFPQCIDQNCPSRIKDKKEAAKS